MTTIWVCNSTNNRRTYSPPIPLFVRCIVLAKTDTMEFYVPLIRAKIGETKVTRGDKVKKTCTFEFKGDEEDIPELFNILLGESKLTTRIDFDCDLLLDDEGKPFKTPFEKLFKPLEDWEIGALIAITPKARKKRKPKPKEEKAKEEPEKEKPKEKKGVKK